MYRQYLNNLTLVLAASLWLQAACGPGQSAAVAREQQGDRPNLSRLKEQVKGVGDEVVFEELERLPRAELISSLNALADKTYEDDGLRVKIAFLFCRLQHNYNENSRIIAQSLSRPSPYDIAPDETIVFAGDLIKRGDKSLLPVVMQTAEQSDGGLAENVSDILYKEATNDTEGFLKSLASLPEEARRAVYEQLNYSLTPPEDTPQAYDDDRLKAMAGDKAKLIRRLKSKTHDKELGGLAEEMLKAIN